MRICLVGPCSPLDVWEIMNEESRNNSSNLVGQRGIPVSSLALALHRLGHNITIISSTNQVTSVQFFSGINFRMYVIPQRKNYRKLVLTFYLNEARMVRKILDEISNSIDIFNVHWTYEFAMATWGLKKPVVITVHDSPWQVLKLRARNPFWYFRYFMGLGVRIFSKSRTFVFVSTDLKNKWRKEFLWLKPSIIIPNVGPFEAENFSSPSSALKQLLVVVGDYTFNKNPHVVLNCLPELNQNLENPIEVHFVGHGLGPNDSLALEKRPRSNLVDIIWEGYLEREAYKNLLRRSTCLVQPSLVESFGLTIIEAFALGVPVICGSNPGPSYEIVGESALVIDMRSTKLLATTILKLLSDDTLQENLRIGGKKRFMEKFESSVVANSYIELYEKELKTV